VLLSSGSSVVVRTRPTNPEYFLLRKAAQARNKKGLIHATETKKNGIARSLKDPQVSRKVLRGRNSGNKTMEPKDCLGIRKLITPINLTLCPYCNKRRLKKIISTRRLIKKRLLNKERKKNSTVKLSKYMKVGKKEMAH